MLIKCGFKDASIRAYHGLYEEEKIKGNQFNVSVLVTFEVESDYQIRSLDQTIDYKALHDLTLEVFEQREDLLETIAQKLFSRIQAQWPNLAGILIQIQKVQPMAMTDVGSSIIEIQEGKI